MKRCADRLFSGGILLSLLISLGTAFTSGAAQTTKDKPAAVVGDKVFYERDFLPLVQSQLNELRNQEYQLKIRALEDAVNRYLLKKEADKRGITEQELLRQVDSKAAQPSQAQRDQAMVERMLGGAPTSNVEQFDKDLKQEKIQQARQEFFQKLRQEAGAKYYLLPAPVEVGYDPARVRGNPGAKITMVEFSDFQCPFCMQAFTTVRNLLKKYDGKVKLAYRDLPLQPVPPGVPGAAEASRCAGEQGKFWEFHDLLFLNQDSFGPAVFKEYADSLHLDAEKFASCLTSDKFKPQVQQDMQEALRLGIKGTPAFFINGVFMSGAQPQEHFEQVIETQLFLLEHSSC